LSSLSNRSRDVLSPCSRAIPTASLYMATALTSRPRSFSSCAFTFWPILRGGSSIAGVASRNRVVSARAPFSDPFDPPRKLRPRGERGGHVAHRQTLEVAGDLHPVDRSRRNENREHKNRIPGRGRQPLHRVPNRRYGPRAFRGRRVVSQEANPHLGAQARALQRRDRRKGEVGHPALGLGLGRRPVGDEHQRALLIGRVERRPARGGRNSGVSGVFWELGY